jgi:hypothetical protein
MAVSGWMRWGWDRAFFYVFVSGLVHRIRFRGYIGRDTGCMMDWAYYMVSTNMIPSSAFGGDERAEYECKPWFLDQISLTDGDVVSCVWDGFADGVERREQV